MSVIPSGRAMRAREGPYDAHAPAAAYTGLRSCLRDAIVLNHGTSDVF
jgi:hypothetical protein